ncbi:MAG: anti-sigma factor [Ruminococcus sp.]
MIGKSNALITPYQSFEGSRTSDNDAFLATYDASVTGFNGQDILVADTDLKENECREIVIRYQFDSLDGDCQLIYISPDLRSKCFLNLPAEALPFSFKLERTTSESPAQTIRARIQITVG